MALNGERLRVLGSAAMTAGWATGGTPGLVHLTETVPEDTDQEASCPDGS